MFQILPLTAPGTLEYTVEIDGQQLRYRNTPPSWSNMVHPGPQGVSGARVSAITFDGRTVELFNQPGQFGLQRLFESAQRTKKDGGVFELRWSAGNVAVAVDLKIVSSAQAGGGGQARGQGFRGMRLPPVIVGRFDAPPSVAPALASTGGQ